jgi:transposase
MVKGVLEAGRRRLSGDTERQATPPKVKELRSEPLAVKECVADLLRTGSLKKQN